MTLVASQLETEHKDIMRRIRAKNYLLDGVVAVEYAAGIGGRLDSLRTGREPHRPPLVSLEVRRNGVQLSLAVSRPVNGVMRYGPPLASWPFSNLARSAMNLSNTKHRRAAMWGVRLAKKLAEVAEDSTADISAHFDWPSMLVPFRSGEEKIDKLRQEIYPSAKIDLQSRPGFTLVDAQIAVRQHVHRAIDLNTVLEDYRDIAGEFTEDADGRSRYTPRVQVVTAAALRNPPFPYSGGVLQDQKARNTHPNRNSR